jgi:hypothetical protein
MGTTERNRSRDETIDRVHMFVSSRELTRQIEEESPTGDQDHCNPRRPKK